MKMQKICSTIRVSGVPKFIVPVVRIVLLSSMLASCAATPAPTSSEVEIEGPVGLEIEARFPANWLHRIELANREFLRTEQDLSCFTVVIGRDTEQNLDFVLIAPSINLTAKGGFGRAEGCGTGVSYYFDDEGNLVRSEMQR